MRAYFSSFYGPSFLLPIDHWSLLPLFSLFRFHRALQLCDHRFFCSLSWRSSKRFRLLRRPYQSKPIQSGRCFQAPCPLFSQPLYQSQPPTWIAQIWDKTQTRMLIRNLHKVISEKKLQRRAKEIPNTFEKTFQPHPKKNPKQIGNKSRKLRTATGVWLALAIFLLRVTSCKKIDFSLKQAPPPPRTGVQLPPGPPSLTSLLWFFCMFLNEGITALMRI